MADLHDLLARAGRQGIALVPIAVFRQEGYYDARDRPEPVEVMWTTLNAGADAFRQADGRLTEYFGAEGESAYCAVVNESITLADVHETPEAALRAALEVLANEGGTDG